MTKSLYPGKWPPRLLRVAAAARCPREYAGTCAFTLIELLLVLALLAVVLSVSLPSLSAFFRGRALDAEARRLLSLTRHGQSRAVSEGMPMLLWVDADQSAYGLEAEPTWEAEDPKAVEFKLDHELKIEAVRTNLPTRQLTAFQLTASSQEPERRELPEIKFLPDGSIAEGSPPEVLLSDRDGAKVTLTQSRNRLYYEIARATR